MSITALGHSIQIHDGRILSTDTSPIWWMAAALILAAVATFSRTRFQVGQRGFTFVVAACLVFNIIQLSTSPLAPYLRVMRYDALALLNVSMVAVAFLAGLVLIGSGRLRACAFAASCLTVAVLAVWMIRNSPDPIIDVYTFQVDASNALAHGHNPYDMTFANIYSPLEWMYGPGLVRSGRVLVGYTYLPETLFFIMPSAFLHADIRYANLAAVLLMAISLVGIWPGLFGYAAALLMLTTPRMFSIVNQSFTDPLALATMALFLLCWKRWPKVLPIALGVFLASKQYVPVTIIFLFCGRRELGRTVRLIAQALIIFAILTVPLALWNLSAFLRSAVLFQVQQPFRNDAISFLALFGKEELSTFAIGFIPAVTSGVTVLALIARRRSIGFSAAVGFFFFVFFAFNKQAFAGYYFFVMGAMALAMAEGSGPPTCPSVEFGRPLAIP